MVKKIVRLKTKELMKAQIDLSIASDSDLASKIGVSTTQVWRVKLSPKDTRYNTPGNQFIAGVMSTFGGPFERFFYLDDAPKV